MDTLTREMSINTFEDDDENKFLQQRHAEMVLAPVTETSVTGNLLQYAELWCNEKSQTSFFRTEIPLSPENFTSKFNSLQLNKIFTSDKIVTKMIGDYNCNHVFRQTKVMPDIVIFSNDKHVVFQPLGEPGRDLGPGHSSKSSHMMVVTYNDEGPITLNEMLPTTTEENEDLKVRVTLMETAYKALRTNKAISECGPVVIAKAASMGIPITIGIREFMAKQIVKFTPEFRSGRPGYKLLNSDDYDISGCKEEIILDNLVKTFTDTNLTVQQFIQGPDNCSQLISHVHGFLLHNDITPQVIIDNYISINDIIQAKCIQ